MREKLYEFVNIIVVIIIMHFKIKHAKTTDPVPAASKSPLTRLRDHHRDHCHIVLAIISSSYLLYRPRTFTMVVKVVAVLRSELLAGVYVHKRSRGRIPKSTSITPDAK
jgi:hypothetical protein